MTGSERDELLDRSLDVGGGYFGEDFLQFGVWVLRY